MDNLLLAMEDPRLGWVNVSIHNQCTPYSSLVIGDVYYPIPDWMTVEKKPYGIEISATTELGEGWGRNKPLRIPSRDTTGLKNAYLDVVDHILDRDGHITFDGKWYLRRFFKGYNKLSAVDYLFVNRAKGITMPDSNIDPIGVRIYPSPRGTKNRYILINGYILPLPRRLTVTNITRNGFSFSCLGLSTRVYYVENLLSIYYGMIDHIWDKEEEIKYDGEFRSVSYFKPYRR